MYYNCMHRVFVNLLYFSILFPSFHSPFGDIDTILYCPMAPHGPKKRRSSGDGQLNGSWHGFRGGSGLGRRIHADHLRSGGGSECLAALLPALPAGPAEQFVFRTWEKFL